MLNALSNFKRSASVRFQTYAEIAALAGSLAGASLSFIFGRVAVAVLLAAVAVGIFFRFNSRAKGAATTEAALPLWVKTTSTILAALETGALVEAVNLPVRYDQPGFEMYHWALVGITFLALYFLQFQVLKRLVKRRQVLG